MFYKGLDMCHQLFFSSSLQMMKLAKPKKGATNKLWRIVRYFDKQIIIQFLRVQEFQGYVDIDANGNFSAKLI